MKLTGTLSMLFIFAVSLFGAIDLLVKGIKPIPAAILFISVITASGFKLYFNKRIPVADRILFFFALVSTPGLSLFLSDLIVAPVAIADDCLGHLPSRIHYMDIMVAGTFVTLICGLLFLTKRKQPSYTERIFSLVLIIILVCFYFEVPFFRTLNQQIDIISTPRVLLPQGCS